MLKYYYKNNRLAGIVLLFVGQFNRLYQYKLQLKREVIYVDGTLLLIISSKVHYTATTYNGLVSGVAPLNQ